jgi:peptide methionine sulfoxide reductase MsrB
MARDFIPSTGELAVCRLTIAHLPIAQFRVLRQKDTEAPGTGKYEHHDESGVYTCAGCGAPLYKSTTKFKRSIATGFEVNLC